MKRAHEGSISCALFRKLIMDFVDDELAESLRVAVLSHAEACPECRDELREIEHVRKLFAGLPTTTVSPEFDFRLKASLHREDVRLRSPLYRAKLFLRENIVPVIGLPAAAAMLIAGVAYYQLPFREAAPPVVQRTAPVMVQEEIPVTVADAGTADVNYVLESLDVNDTGIEVTSNGKPGVSEEQPDIKTVSSINF